MTRESGEDKSRSSSWTPCPVGEIEGLANRLRARRRRRVFLQTAGATLATIAAVGGLALWWGTSDDTPPGGITCAEVEKLLELFARGQLEASLQQRVRTHASQCPRCEPRFRALGLPI